MSDKLTKHSTRPTKAKRLAKILKESLPEVGKVRITQIAAHLGIGASARWSWEKERGVLPLIKYGVHIAVWTADYIRQLVVNGISAKPQKVAQAGYCMIQKQQNPTNGQTKLIFNALNGVHHE